MKWLQGIFWSLAIVWTLIALLGAYTEHTKESIVYSGDAFEIQTIKGECYARDRVVWFDCHYFFKNKVLVRAAR